MLSSRFKQSHEKLLQFVRVILVPRYVDDMSSCLLWLHVRLLELWLFFRCAASMPENQAASPARVFFILMFVSRQGA